VRNPPVRITDELLMLGTPQYPLYLVETPGEMVLFEGGTGAVGPILLEQLDALGIDRARIRQLVVTHAHPDHVMAVPLLRRSFPGVAVLASEAAARTLQAEKAVAAFSHMDDALTDALHKAGAVAPEHRRMADEKQIAVDRVIGEGDTIAVDGLSFTVLETPGHSDCSLSFFEPQQRVLVISDATGYYLPEPDFWWPNYFADYRKYLGSMERLAGLGAEVLCLSHNAAIRGAEDVAAYFAAAIAATRQYHARIVAEARSGKTVREIAEALGAEVFRRTQLLPVEFFQKNCGLLVKLSLRHEGIEPKPA